MRRLSLFVVAALVLLASACGGGKHAAGTTAPASTAAAPATSTAAAGSTTSPAGTQPSAPGALVGEAGAKAAGDIPDNQVFVTYSGPSFSMKMPEGWARSGTAAQTTFRDRNNLVRVVIGPGGPPTVAELRRQLAALANVRVVTPPQQITIGGIPAVRAVYSTKSAPNPVTGKVVTLSVDRYVIAGNGHRAVIDLGSPVGVDNVDAYKMMVQSFKLK